MADSDKAVSSEKSGTGAEAFLVATLHAPIPILTVLWLMFGAPKMIAALGEMAMELPHMTLVAISATQFLTRYWPAAVLLLAAALVADGLAYRGLRRLGRAWGWVWLVAVLVGETAIACSAALAWMLPFRGSPGMPIPM